MTVAIFLKDMCDAHKPPLHRKASFRTTHERLRLIRVSLRNLWIGFRFTLTYFGLAAAVFFWPEVGCCKVKRFLPVAACQMRNTLSCPPASTSCPSGVA